MLAIKVPIKTNRIVRQTIVAKERSRTCMPTIGRAGGQMGKLLCGAPFMWYLWLETSKGLSLWPCNAVCVDQSNIFLATISNNIPGGIDAAFKFGRHVFCTPAQKHIIGNMGSHSGFSVQGTYARKKKLSKFINWTAMNVTFANWRHDENNIYLYNL